VGLVSKGNPGLIKKYRRLWVMLLLSLVVIWGLLRLGNIEVSYDTLVGLNWRWLGLVFVIFYSGVFVRGLRWQQILKTMGWPIGYVYTQTLLMAGFFVSLVLPARLGDVGRVVMLKQDHHIPLAQGAASLATERALDVAAILALAFVGAVSALPGRVPPQVNQLMWGAAILFALGLLGLLVTPGLENWLRRPGRLATICPAKLWSLYQKGLDFGFTMLKAIRALGQKPLALTLVVLESLYIWLCDALIIYWGLRSMNAATSLSVSLLAGMISDLSVAVPITPAGLGQFEVVLVGLLTLLGVNTASASLTVLLTRLVSFWSFLPIGGVVMYSFGFARLFSMKGKEGHMSPLPPATKPTEG
jgi:uncharacterized protein (TIRG00374 family)